MEPFQRTTEWARDALLRRAAANVHRPTVAALQLATGLPREDVLRYLANSSRGYPHRVVVHDCRAERIRENG